jgi:hypothetical protein
MENKNNKRHSSTELGSHPAGADALSNQVTQLSLPEYLDQVADFRRGQGRMHNLNTILLLVLMATMSGYYGQRATGDFVRKHHKALVKVFKPKRQKLPSYQTIARVMQRLDYDELTAAFFAWAKTVIPLTDKDWASFDGKAIHGTTTDPGTSKQCYTNLVSLFATKSKLVITQGKVANKTNEIPLVQQLVSSLGLTGLVFTADALHCQKATVTAIIESSNDYVIGVKDNQKKLHEQLKRGRLNLYPLAPV